MFRRTKRGIQVRPRLAEAETEPLEFEFVPPTTRSYK
jgi:hypothetical protein